MATLAPQGRITVDVVDDEIQRLNASWHGSSQINPSQRLLIEVLGEEAAAQLDQFDAVQLAAVLQACQSHTSASAAGRALFASSRLEKKSSNDADRLSKYLARFGLKFSDARIRP